MKPFPTREEWEAALATGWRSNGCSNAPDNLLFGPFKLANDDPTTYPPLACDRHDMTYSIGGNEMDRIDADVELYRDLMLLVESAGALHPSMLGLWREQALAYFNAVRRFGASHWKYV